MRLFDALFTLLVALLGHVRTSASRPTSLRGGTGRGGELDVVLEAGPVHEDGFERAGTRPVGTADRLRASGAHVERYRAAEEPGDEEYELVAVRIVPVEPRENEDTDETASSAVTMSSESDPWSTMAAELGIDLNEYNVTFADDEGEYEGGAEDELRRGRRRLVSVNAWENNNARFCQYERRRRGLQSISWSADLVRQAQSQASYMSRIQRIAHRPNLAQGVEAGWTVITENVSQNVNVQYNGAHRTLMNSPGHRANILHHRVSRVGMGIVKSGPYFYICQIFKGST